MAVLKEVPGAAVCIYVDGQPLQEYDDNEEIISQPEDDVARHRVAKTICKYIVSDSEKEYAIYVKLDKSFDFDCPTVWIKVKIDGEITETRSLNKRHGRPSHNRLRRPLEKKITAVRSVMTGTFGQMNERKLQFGKINVDDSKLDEVKTDSKVIDRVGEVIVELYRASEFIPTRNPWTEPAPSVNKESLNVHEKALKGQAKSHSTILGPAGPALAARLVVGSFTAIDGNNSPFAIFKFKYRSAEALKQLLVIPRTPSPELEQPGQGSVLDIESLDDEQKKKLESFWQDLTGKKIAPRTSFKREVDESGAGESLRKRTKLRKSTTIGLTAESDEEIPEL